MLNTLQQAKHYLMMPMIALGFSAGTLVAAHYAAEIGLLFNRDKQFITFLYVGLFFLSHLLFFAPFASTKEPYRVLCYAAVLAFAVYNTLARYEAVKTSPQRFIKHDLFIQPYILHNSV